MFNALLFGLLAANDQRSIVDRMNSPRSTVGLLANAPQRTVSSDAQKFSWSAFKGSFRQNLGDFQVGAAVDQSKKNDFFHTASVARKIVDSDLKLDAQLTHDFSDESTRLEASLLTKDGLRLSADVDRNLKVKSVDISKEFSDLPLSRQLGERLTLSPSVAVESRELTLELQQDIGVNNVVIPSAVLGSDGSLQKWGIGWMSKLSNGDAVHAQVDPECAKLDVRYDKACDDGSQWRISCNVPSLTADNVLGSTAWSVTRAWNN